MNALTAVLFRSVASCLAFRFPTRIHLSEVVYEKSTSAFNKTCQKLLFTNNPLKNLNGTADMLFYY